MVTTYRSGAPRAVSDANSANAKFSFPAADSEKHRRKKRSRKNSYQTILGIFMVTVGMIFIGIIAALKSLPAPHHLVRRPLSAPIERAPSNSTSVESSERPFNRTLTSNALQVTEKRILLDAQDELNKFPCSIGSDTDHNNHNWEWILHPGLEALKYLHGESYTLKHSKASASDVAAMLLGKKKNMRDLENTNNEPETLEKTVELGYMRVPKFWDPEPFRVIADLRDQMLGDSSVKASVDNDWGVRRYLGNYGSRLMTPEEAKSIGSYTKSKNDDNNLETIFVTIASYRDWQCSATVESVFFRASHPERIRVGVVDQIHEDDTPCSIPPEGPCENFPDQATCKYKDHIDYLIVDAQLSVGPVFARHLGHRLYRGEYFALQSDAHITFVSGWDDEIVSQWHSAKNEMAVLSTYLSGVEGHIDAKTGTRTSKSRPIMCESDFEGTGEYKHLRHGQQPEGIPYIHDMPTLNPFWAAGFSFGRGHFVVNVPYDQHLPWIFQGEEISMGLRGFSYGYDYYAAEKSVCFHYYGRSGIPMFWENAQKYRGSGELGMTRLNAIIHMLPSQLKSNKWIKDDEMTYGLGKVRDVQRFFDTFGIHVQTQTVEQHLCRFVGRPMQAEFIPYLRSNGMGLDYDKISYRFKDT